MEKTLFLKNFLKNPLRNASVIPSSAAAARAMVDGINWDKINTVVELGPGNGVFTEEILANCKEGTTIILIEIEESYIKLLNAKFDGRIHIEHTSAHLMDEVLAKYDKTHADLIISGLPFLPDEYKTLTNEAILRHTEKGAIYRFFTYMPPVMKRVYKDMPLEEIRFVPANIPPMWIYGIN
ncbi:MAG: rRNA adenine N-6-methyltransferase family protein [Bacteroidia bacterium]|nr:rRNA adenine N-6-methyltransferase family protein [Bacteroidia bacterium]